MKKYRLFTLLFLWLGNSLSAQHLVSSTLLGSKTKAQLTTQFGIPILKNGAKYYRITYTTTDVHGLPDTASGLVAIPDDFNNVYPRLVYQHGTAGSRLDVPSYNVVQNGEGSIGLLFAGLGYVALLPDYLGLGVSHGFHPYVHAASEASAALDMLRALPEFAAQTGAHVNNQLFVTGYSQGGHASMALQHEIETNSAAEFQITAAAHNSGPYSIGEIMRDLILTDKIYYYPAYIPNTILSYQTVYGNLYNQLSDVFKEPYATKIDQYYQGSISLDQLNDQLVALLKTSEGDSYPFRMLQPDLVQTVIANPDHPFNVALRENDVYAWGPKSPTRIFYCKADDQVPYQNSIVAYDTMFAKGAVNLIATDVNSGADHGGCVTPALTNTVIFFLNFQQISAFVSTGAPAVQPLALQPNPADNIVLLQSLPGDGRLSITDLQGRLRYDARVLEGEHSIGVNALENGIYLVRFISSEGGLWQGKLAVQH